MSGAYTSDGRRISSMGHAKHGHVCGICGKVSFGNGGKVAHGRSHVRRGEAVELYKWRDFGNTSRIFLAADDAERIERFVADGFEQVAA